MENDLLRFEQWANKYRTLAIKKAVVLELELIGISVHVSVIREIVRDQYPRLNPTDREVLWALKVPTVVKVGPGRYQPARRSSLASAEAELERAVILRAYDHNLDRLQIDIPLDKSDSDLERISERVSQHEHEKQKALSNPHKMYLNRITNLTELHLGHEQISDVSPLTSLTNLTVLEISGNQISDISPLASLTNLTMLNLGNNWISDVSPLALLTNLFMLNLRGNPLDLNDIQALRNIGVIVKIDD